MQIVQFAAFGVIFCCGLGTTKGELFCSPSVRNFFAILPDIWSIGSSKTTCPERSPNGMEERSFYGRNEAPRYSYRSKPKVTWLFHA